METIRIVLADDHAVVRSGLRLLLDGESGLEVVAEAGDLDSARRYVRGQHPDVLILDLNMPGGSSLEAIPDIRSEAPQTQIVVLTMQQEPAFARHALGAGAIGYVLKEAADDELVEAVRRAAAGESYLNPKLGARMASEPAPGPPDDLSERELEVLRLIALGHTNAEIAEQLYLSVRTVETHRAHIQQKLGLSSRAGARRLRAAARAGQRLSTTWSPDGEVQAHRGQWDAMARIGLLTGGGDCPGLNAVIRAVVRRGLLDERHSFVGFRRGWAGVLENDAVELTRESTAGILPAAERSSPARAQIPTPTAATERLPRVAHCKRAALTRSSRSAATTRSVWHCACTATACRSWEYRRRSTTTSAAPTSRSAFKRPYRS